MLRVGGADLHPGAQDELDAVGEPDRQQAAFEAADAVHPQECAGTDLVARFFGHRQGGIRQGEPGVDPLLAG
ncbi:hypothetical protein [Streptomyces sp. NPDC090445]|uniref:hypothetical protein n=1 Tax=Streptomyces sp. NPDC090445 TaxID=3365963 RepID=UPI0037F9F543